MAKGELDQPRRGADQEKELLGWLKEFLSQFRVAWNLLWDSRVPLTTKLVPLLMVLYLLMPIDIIPDALLGLGQVDDLVLVLVGLRMFISLSPPAVVAEYQGASGDESTQTEVWTASDDQVIDLEAKVPEAGNASSGVGSSPETQMPPKPTPDESHSP